MGKKTIAFDIDDVLAANAEGFAKFSNKRWGTNLTPDDYSEHWTKMWGVDHTEAAQRREVIIREKVFTSYQFFNEAKPVLKRLKNNYKLVVVSSRSNEVRKDTLDWIKAEYNDIFAEIHFAKMWDNPKLSELQKLKMTKAEICQEVDADYLVDDQPKHCIAVAQAGIKTVLFGNYRWNRNAKLTKNMVRAKDWLEVEKYFNEQHELQSQK